MFLTSLWYVGGRRRPGLAMKRTFALATCAAAMLAAGCRSASDAAPEQPFSDEGVRAAMTISGDYMRGVIAELADDRYEGRGPGTPGDERARRWLAAELERLGFAPGGPEGAWEQPFDLVGLDAQMPAVWTFTRDGKSVSLERHAEYVAASGVQQPAVALADAELVFAGYGIQAPEYAWDDFKGADLRGKILVLLNNDPDWDPVLFGGETRLYYGRWTYKYESAARQGAAGAIIIHTVPSAGYPWQVVQTSFSGEQFELPAGDEPRLQVKAWITEEAARKLLSLSGQTLEALVAAARSREFGPVPLGLRTSLAFATTITRTSTANVLGLLPGSDTDLAREVVIYTAHHDHLGIGEPDETGDRIYNGALDNAAGVAQVLAIAQAFAALPEPPRRSILVNFVGAEEQGLLGSAYYAAHPTFPPGRIAANINFDGGDILGKARDLVFIGKGRSTLDPIVEAIAKRQGRVVVGDRFPDRGFFYRSDQFNFARVGVPALYIDNSTDIIGREPGWGRTQREEYEALHYHQPSDELSPAWDYTGMVDNARAGFLAGLIVANADELPAWRAGDEFEAARRAALAALAP